MKGLKKVDFYLLATIIMLLIWWGCSDDQNPFGMQDIVLKSSGKPYHLIKRGNVQEFTAPYPDVEVGTSYELLIGEFRQVRSTILLQFTAFPDTLDTLAVSRAQLIIEPIYKIKGIAPQPMHVRIQEITTSWNEETRIPESILTQVNSEILATATIDPFVVSADTIEISPGVVEKWILNKDANYGLMMIPEQADHMAVYYSDDTGREPLLKIWYTRKGKNDSLAIAASQGYSLFQSNFEIPENRLVVGSGIGYVSFFKVDYDSIPVNSTINKATLIFTVDTLQSIHPEGYIQELTNLRMNTDDWALNISDADSTTRDTTQYNGDRYLTIDLTGILQAWINGDSPDYGIRLLPLVLDRSLFRTVLYSSTEPDTALRPKLEVYYTTPPVQSE